MLSFPLSLCLTHSLWIFFLSLPFLSYCPSLSFYLSCLPLVALFLSFLISLSYFLSICLTSPSPLTATLYSSISSQVQTTHSLVWRMACGPFRRRCASCVVQLQPLCPTLSCRLSAAMKPVSKWVPSASTNASQATMSRTSPRGKRWSAHYIYCCWGFIYCRHTGSLGIQAWIHLKLNSVLLVSLFVFCLIANKDVIGAQFFLLSVEWNWIELHSESHTTFIISNRVLG